MKNMPQKIYLYFHLKFKLKHRDASAGSMHYYYKSAYDISKRVHIVPFCYYSIVYFVIIQQVLIDRI